MAELRGRFEVGALLAQARRVAGLSQRELAAAAGVAASTVGGVESGAKGVSVEVLAQLLEPTGLRLAVLDADDREVGPFPADAVRDNAGRRFPAHLDLLPPDQVPHERLRSPRYDRMPPVAWYHRRATSDRLGDDESRIRGERPDHPTAAQLEFRRQERMYGRTRWWPARAATLVALARADGD
ncbi:helix-turn-helix domain-containing protein [Nostocoides sp. HKS02]|uniref:helix-turn-helix domain-containing protein n=1 Tax=Nostocoides sp. HKS02 TaxID=1813880 RepID=UPI0018A82379|nr:helix-turn-helix transcriptional regulator [Tetrasphaera sp. HKS02]